MSETALYRKFDLIAAPQKMFVMCSSEEAADAFDKLMIGDYIATTWPPNAGAWEWADLQPLVKRTGLLIPDADPDARQAMQRLGRRLAEVGCNLHLIDTAAEPQDWTLGDWAGSKDEFIAWAKARKTAFVVEPPPAEEPASDPEGPPDYDAPPDEEAEDAPPIPLSEDAFANHFAKVNGENWRCVKAWGKWFNWDGEAWAEDRTDAKVQPMRDILRAAQNWPISKELTSSAKRAIFGRQVTIWAALRLAGTDERIRAEPEIWDEDPWALGVPGGVVDLKSGKMHNSAREQHLTMRCSVAPASGTPERWLKLLKQSIGDDDVIAFLRRYLGYALTGDSREQCMVFFYGPAQSGKGTILRAISRIMGSAEAGGGKFRSYHYEAPIQTFMEARNERHSTEIAAFYKKRLITSEEPAAGAKWDESKLKWITGGSQITARFIAQDNFSFAMTGKIIVAANHRPRLSTTDKAIRRRMMVVPFEHPVQDEDRDNELDAKLKAEYPQILAWMLQGCLEWQDAGLGLPEKIAATTDSYLESEDTLGAWMAENCEFVDECDGVALYENYARWCEIQGETKWARRGWSNALIDRGFKTRKSDGHRIFLGIRNKLGSNL